MSSGASTVDLTLERSIYIGNSISAILYGLELYMYFQSVYYLWTSPPGKRQPFYVIYGGIMLILITFAVSANAVFGQLMWIEHRDYPGGPPAYYTDKISLWINTLGSSADVATNFMGDGLLLYRCYIIWGSRLWVIAIPFLIYLASTATAIITVVESALPGASIFQGSAANFGIPWVSLTVSLNVLLTVMISTRLLLVRRHVRAVMPKEMGKMYTSVVAVLIESALPFSALGLAFVVTYAKNSQTEIALAFIWGTFCALSPQLIILRVTMGRGWSKDTMNQVTTTLAFASDFGRNTDAAAMDSLGGPDSTAVGSGIMHHDHSIKSLRSEPSKSELVTMA